VKKIRDRVGSDRKEEITAACDELNALWNEISTKMYEKATASDGQQRGTTDSQPPKDKVEEADFEVVDDEAGKK
jgi:hypothetical protein